MNLHLLLATAALTFASTYTAALFGMPNLVFISWRYFGRFTTSGILVLVLGIASGAPWTEVLSTTALAAAMWGQLGAAAAASVPPKTKWGLFLTGLLSGAVAFHAVSCNIEKAKLGTLARTELRKPSDLALFCLIAYGLGWLATEGVPVPPPPAVDVLLNGTIDALFVCGCGHIFLKKVDLL